MVDGQLYSDAKMELWTSIEVGLDGFGNTTGEYWVGLKDIDILTTISSELYIEMETFEHDNVSPASAFAEYSTFKVNGESDEYRLSVSGYNGNCADSFSNHNGWKFSTFDNDNDETGSGNCAVDYNGAWWYRACHACNLNGLYLGGSNTEYGKELQMFGCETGYFLSRENLMNFSETWKDNIMAFWITPNGLYKIVHRQPGVFDFLSLYELGNAEDGVYVIQMKEGVNIDVWCDMSNGG
ncbi:fibrinogen C domain-containing protein 1-like [Ruditapes philippinarum]|uniref:fibrinogen C domain-containing protein 1-like n=1 Tax=Ruditapes philippinarum TaxID=129788 RepID=UPI00295A9E57|nr:fibrinogen C domain-containing protein 1-like [Ruditapes philippinarum]